MPPEPFGVESVRELLLGREVSAVCFVRDYVELHFDGPILRAISDPYGAFGRIGWRFPDGDAAVVMLGYIGTVVDRFRFVEDGFLALDAGEHSFVVPLDDSSRRGPEAVHIIGVDEDGITDAKHMWIW